MAEVCDLSGESMLSFSTYGRLSRVNSQWAQMFGYSKRVEPLGAGPFCSDMSNSSSNIECSLSLTQAERCVWMEHRLNVRINTVDFSFVLQVKGIDPVLDSQDGSLSFQNRSMPSVLDLEGSLAQVAAGAIWGGKY
jgi:hypothetical protein